MPTPEEITRHHDFDPDGVERVAPRRPTARITVVDPRDEDAYRPSLESAGFSLTLREARWHEHRLFKPTDGLAHVHVFGPDCPETIRHVMLRDWLRTHPDDAAEYAAIKRRAAEATNAQRGTGMDYNLVKEPYLRSLLDRIFTANGLL